MALSRETLIQRTAVAPGRFRSREIVSEYSIGEINGFVHEFRQVATVDGREFRAPGQAREMLVSRLKDPRDRVRKSMLQELRRHGLEQPITDLALLVLLFTKNHLADYRFEPGGEALIGADRVRVMHYRQNSGPQSLMVIQDRKVIQQPLEGDVFSRAADGLPLRITMRSQRTRGKHRYREEASVDYSMSPHGFLAPVSAVHRGYTDGRLRVENLFRYAPFQKFGASTEIKFTEVPEVK